jgi:large subunit ribosomal protein L54
MICRSCLLLRAPAARTAPSCAPAAAAAAVARLSLLPRRGFALTRAVRADPPPSATDAAAAGAAPTTATPPLTNPLSTGGGAASSSGAAADAASILRTPAPPKSSCLPGTPLEGLNFLKDRQDPVALPDDEYPDWLWTILEREEKEVGTGDAGEFSKSKKERKLAIKKARLREELAIASGNLDALAPKIPLQHQSVNLPGDERGSIADAVHASQVRERLRRAMRKERMVQIREKNYLSTI